MIVRKKYLIMGLLLSCLLGSAVFYLKSNAGEPKGKLEIKWLYPPKYYSGTHFSEGRAWVQEQKDGPWTLLDDQGNILKTGFQADSVGQYRDGIAGFSLTRKDMLEQRGGFLDRSGDVVLLTESLDGVDVICGEGLIARKNQDGLYGFIGLSGKWVIPPAYEDVFLCFQEGLVAVKKGGKYGYIDKEGTVVIDFKFDFAYWFSHKMAAVCVGDKWGVIDPKGRWIAEPIYEKHPNIAWTEPFALQKDGKVGFIDSKGNVVIDFQFPVDPPVNGRILNNLYGFVKGRAIVILDASDKENLEYGLIDETGKVLFQKKGSVLISQGDYTLCRWNGNEGISLVDREGKEYELPDDFRYPFMGIRPNESNIFAYRDFKKQKFGYFTVSANHD